MQPAPQKRRLAADRPHRHTNTLGDNQQPSIALYLLRLIEGCTTQFWLNSLKSYTVQLDSTEIDYGILLFQSRALVDHPRAFAAYSFDPDRQY